MKRTASLLWLIPVLIFLSFGSSEPSSELTCGNEKVLLEINTAPTDDNIYKNKIILVAVLIRGADEKGKQGLESEKYLHQRSDGWTHLSTESDHVRPGETVSNCLPQGVYDVRLEYHERKPFIGDWLIYYYEVRISQQNFIVTDSQGTTITIPNTTFLSPVVITEPSFGEMTQRYGLLFGVYTLCLLTITIALVFAAWKTWNLVVRRFRNSV